MKRLSLVVLTLCLALAPVTGTLPASHLALAGSPTLTLNFNQTGARISPTLFGLMFEDINHSGDGGIYAELISNRSFLDNPAVPSDWSIVTSGRAAGTIKLDTSRPINLTALTTSVRLTISRVAHGERAGVANGGYYGIPEWPGTTYHASFYARSDAGFTGPLTVSLESTSGQVYASATVPSITTAWRHYAVTLTTPPGILPTQTNQFVIAATHTGTVWLNLVSLFPPTWNNRPNGLRVDLMQMLQGMHPSFLRFPGGNFLEGQTIDTRFEWKDTIGALAQRPGHQDDAWGYRSSDGLGLLEYLEWCQDLHLVPVLAVYAGYSLQGEYVPAGPQLRPYVQDALDEIQYATGSTHTTWGARRAADGHPAPFKVPYVEVGNEDFFDRSGSYDGRFAQFYDAIKRDYPSIKLMATTTVHGRTPDVYDQHFYQTPNWFFDHTDYYDQYDRHGPKIFVGEYAARTSDSDIGQGPATLGTALGEAAWITGLERNADQVVMAAYAPLFQNVNESQWSPDLISFDSLTSYGSPSYYVQQLFSLNHGDVVVPATLTGGGSLAYVASKDTRTGATYLTVVNTSSSAQTTHLVLKGLASLSAGGTATVLTSSHLDDENSLSTPKKVAPRTHRLTGVGTTFTYRFQPNSLTILRLTSR